MATIVADDALADSAGAPIDVDILEIKLTALHLSAMICHHRSCLITPMNNNITMVSRPIFDAESNGAIGGGRYTTRHRKFLTTSPTLIFTKLRTSATPAHALLHQ